jgi:hypothetical protein
MATHGRARELTIAALQSRKPFNRAGFAMKGVEGAVSSTGRMPAGSAGMYRDNASEDMIAYTVLSYATPIAWVTREGTVIIPEASYSNTTTHHQGLCAAYL